MLGFVPGVLGQGELVMVNGKDGLGIEVLNGLLQAFRRGVNQRPVAEGTVCYLSFYPLRREALRSEV